MQGTLFERFTDCAVLSESTAFRVLGAFDPKLDRRVALVVTSESCDRALGAQALDKLFAAQRDPPHALIARAVERGTHADAEFVVFDFPARFDLERLVQIAGEKNWKCDAEAADGFTLTLREAVVATEERLGTLALGNVLFATDGSYALVGFGHNVLVLNEHGRLVPRGRFFQAPEVAAGAEPTVSSDFVGIIRMTRMLMPFVRIPEAIGRCLTGRADPSDAELAQTLMRFETEVVLSTPDRRPPIAEIIALSERLRALVHVHPRPEAYREVVARVVATEHPELLGSPRTMQLAHDLSWFELAGERRALTPLLGRILDMLARERMQRPGQVVPADRVIEMAWAGERMSHASGRNRLYVAINALRKAGLADDVEGEAGGYRLRPSLRVERVP